jgi:thermitase
MRLQQPRRNLLIALVLVLLILLLIVVTMMMNAGGGYGGGYGGGGAGGGVGGGHSSRVAPVDPAMHVKAPNTGLLMVSNEILVYSESMTAADIARIEHETGARLVGTVPLFDLLQFRLPTDTPVEETLKIIEKLRDEFDIETVTPNMVLEPQAYLPEDGDGFNKKDWKSDEVRDENWAWKYINAPAAWGLVKGDKRVKIGIIDVFPSINHEDLKNQIDNSILRRELYPKLLKRDDTDKTSHGVHVAGIAAAEGDNSKGIAGLGHGCRLYLYDVGLELSAIAEAFSDAKDDGCHVVNCSFGPAWDHDPANPSDDKQREKDLERLEDYRNYYKRLLKEFLDNNIIVTNSAGNGYKKKDQNGQETRIRLDAKWNGMSALENEFDNLIVVANSSRDGKLSASSGNGDCVTVAAPGEKIWSCVLNLLKENDRWRIDDKLSAKYEEKTGTSMAAPFVAGLVGLILSADLQANSDQDSPTLTPAQVKEIIKHSAQTAAQKYGRVGLDGGNFYIIDAEQAVREAFNTIGQSRLRASATAIVIDVSGSMSEISGGRAGGTKLDGAKTAALKLLSTIGHDVKVHQSEHQLSVVGFNSTAFVAQELTSEFDAVEEAINDLLAYGQTDLGAGLSVGLSQLAHYSGDDKSILLLSDGIPNVGLLSGCLLDLDDDQNPVRSAWMDGIPIYVVGFGAPGGFFSFSSGLDESLLTGIADSTGGQYYYADESFQLQNAYLQMFHERMGELLDTYEGVVQQGEHLKLGVQQIERGTEELYVTLNYEGSRLELAMTDPSGQVVDEDYPGADLTTGCPVSLFIRTPQAGQWQCAVIGAECPYDGEPFEMVISSRINENEPEPEPSYGGGGAVDSSDEMYMTLAIVAFVLLLSVLAVGVLKRRRPQLSTRLRPAPVWAITIREPGLPSRLVSYRGPAIRIGTGPDNQIVLNDRTVGARHLLLRRVGGRFVVEDLGSVNGTWVGSVRLSNPVTVPRGQTIRVGRTFLTLR